MQPFGFRFIQTAEDYDMRFGPFLAIAFILFILWLGAFVFFHVASFLIHILLVLALIAFVVHFLTGSKA